jgi:hypothetical protein
MIFFGRSSSSTAFSSWQAKNARQTLGDKLVCISNLQHYPHNRLPRGGFLQTAVSDAPHGADPTRTLTVFGARPIQH